MCICRLPNTGAVHHFPPSSKLAAGLHQSIVEFISICWLMLKYCVFQSCCTTVPNFLYFYIIFNPKIRNIKGAREQGENDTAHRNMLNPVKLSMADYIHQFEKVARMYTMLMILNIHKLLLSPKLDIHNASCDTQLPSRQGIFMDVPVK